MGLFRRKKKIQVEAAPAGVGLPGDAYGSVLQVDVYGAERPPSKSELIQNYKGVIHACANINASAVASCTRRLYAKLKKGDPEVNNFPYRELTHVQKEGIVSNNPRLSMNDNIIEIEEHPALDLLHKPNDEQDSFSFVATMSLYIDTVGSSYSLISLDGLDTPVELWHMMPQFMVIKRDTFGRRYGYQYGTSTQAASNKVIPITEVLPIKEPDLNDLYGDGYSRVRAAWEAIQVLNQMNAQSKFSLARNNRPDVAASPKDKENILGPEALQKLERRINHKFSRQRTGGVAVFPEALDFKPLTYSNKDMERIEEYKRTKEEVANIMGVPMSMLTTETNLANSRAGLEQHMRHLVYPRCKLIDESLNNWVIPHFDPTGRLFFATDNPIPKDQKIIVDTRVSHLKAGVTTVNEERTAEGLEPFDDPKFDLPFATGGQTPEIGEEDKGEQENRPPVDSDDPNEPEE